MNFRNCLNCAVLVPNSKLSQNCGARAPKKPVVARVADEAPGGPQVGVRHDGLLSEHLLVRAREHGLHQAALGVQEQAALEGLGAREAAAEDLVHLDALDETARHGGVDKELSHATEPTD